MPKYQTQIANARLMAAAPELLEALEAMFRTTKPTCHKLYVARDMAESAIAKAKGEK